MVDKQKLIQLIELLIQKDRLEHDPELEKMLESNPYACREGHTTINQDMISDIRQEIEEIDFNQQQNN